MTMRRGKLPGNLPPPGFTLVEVLVALTIVALSLAAAFAAVSQTAVHSATLRDKTLANWAAMNKITELRLEQTWPDVGESDGEVEFADHEWRWVAEVSETPVEQMRRVDVSVSFLERPDEILSVASGFLGPEGPPTQVSQSWSQGADLGSDDNRRRDENGSEDQREGDE